MEKTFNEIEQIDALQTTINSLIEKIEALEAKNP
nr:MAG: hypothetical protein [Bacteriophage sp.]